MPNREYNRAYYRANKDRITQKQAEWYAANRERMREADRIHPKQNKIGLLITAMPPEKSEAYCASLATWR